MANINASGSSVLVLPNAAVKFLGHGMELTTGSVSVATSEGMEVMRMVEDHAGGAWAIEV